MNQIPTIHRHGDVLLVQVDELPIEAPKDRDQGRVVLAYGEVTGHSHSIVAENVLQWNVKAQRYTWSDGAESLFQSGIRVDGEGAVLDHEEHGKLALAGEGTCFMVIRQREYAPAEFRLVAD